MENQSDHFEVKVQSSDDKIWACTQKTRLIWKVKVEREAKTHACMEQAHVTLRGCGDGGFMDREEVQEAGI